MNKYNDKYIIDKIINTNFSFADLNPKLFKNMRHGEAYYCMFHQNSHTGTKQARLYYNDEWDIFYIHCFAEGKNYTPADYVRLIMCNEKGLYKSPLNFLHERMSEDDIKAQYTIFDKNRKERLETQFQKKSKYIDNVYNSTGNIVDYIEALYCEKA